jgi:putative tryptophan/tyrosine transport system substrate-binding protein
MRRREFIGIFAAAVTWPLVARAQQPAMPVIGVLGSGSAAAYTQRLSLIRQALAEAGFTEGHTVAMEYRWAEGQLDRLPGLAAELVAHKVNVVIATGGLQASHAAILATRAIPIVFSTDGDPVKQGLVGSLNRPDRNATGITVFSASLTAKRLEVLRDLAPKATVFGMLVNPAAPQAPEQIQDAEKAAGSLGLELQLVRVRNDAEFEPALTKFGEARGAVLLVSADPLFIAGRETLVAVANRHSIPAIYGRRDFAVAGGLASYGADVDELYRLMGTYVGRILKGEKPADLPVAQPSKFELVLNLKTAKILGVHVPDHVLALADKVIE